MGTALGIAQDTWDNTKAKERSIGFELPPAGMGIEWVISGFKLGTSKKTNEDYLQIMTTMTTDGSDGEEPREIKHSNFFWMDKDGVADLKFFLEKAGASWWNSEENDLEELEGTKFRADFAHYKSNEKDADGKPVIKGNIVKKTMVAGWDDDEEEEQEEAPAKPAKKRGRPKAVKPVEQSETVGEADDDEDDDDDEEELPDVRPSRIRKKRRLASTDK